MGSALVIGGGLLTIYLAREKQVESGPGEL
jgi:hypothetical protein